MPALALGQEPLPKEIEQAKTFAQKGDWISAKRVMDQALAAHGGDWRVYHEAALLQARRRRFREAADLLRIARSMNPSELRVLHDLASNLQNQGLFGEALDVWRALEAEIQRNPNEAMARHGIPFNRGLCAEKVELMPEAIESYGRAIHMAARSKEEATYRKHLGALLFSRGEFEAALKELDALVLLSPGDGEAHYFLGSTLATMGETERAERHLIHARRLLPKDSRVDARLGAYYLQQKELSKALTYLNESVAKNPMAHEPWFSLRAVYAQLGDNEQAEHAAQEYKRFRQMATDAEEVLRAYRRRQIQNPRDADAYFEEANMLFQNGRIIDGIARLQMLLAYNPNHELAILNLAAALVNQGDPQGAIFELEKILEKNPNQPFANLNMAQLLAGQNRHAEALTAAARALDRIPGKDQRQVQAANVLTFCASRLQDVSMALAPLMKLAEKFEGDPDLLLPTLDLLFPVTLASANGAAAMKVLDDSLRSLGREHPRLKELAGKMLGVAQKFQDEDRAARYTALLNDLK